MRRRMLLAVFAALALLAPLQAVRAEDSVQVSQTSAVLGEHVRIQIQVTVPAAATVELTPGTPTWSGIELVGIDEITKVPQGDEVLWFIDARVAPFLPGTFEFAPTVAVVVGSEASSLQLPPVRFTAVPTLAADADLVLSPLAPPREIAGGESPLLRPAIVGGVAVGAALLALIAWLLLRTVSRRLRRTSVGFDAPVVPPSLEGAEQLLNTDPVGAYRMMSAVVKTELARRHNLRATALTSSELRRKLESEGDRWEARLVGGLLEECDSVIYAGYRPATERREADLTMAREIVEAAG